MSSGKEDTRCDDSSLSVVNFLDQFSDTAKCLLAPLGKFLSESMCVLSNVEDAGKNIGVNVDVHVAMVIEDLKVVLHEVGCKLELYVSSCRNMAEYVTDAGLMKEVKDDLDAGSTEELNDFVEDVSAFMETCIKYLDDFQNTEAKVRSEIVVLKEQHKAKENKATNRARLSKSMAVSTRYLANGAGATGVVLIGTGILVAPFGIAAIAGLSIAGGCFVVGAAVAGGIAAAFAIDAGITHQQKQVFFDAAQRIAKIYRVLTGVRETALSMETSMQKVSNSIGNTGENRGLRYHAENPTRKHGKTTLRHVRKIKTSLDSIHRAMEEVLSYAKSYPTIKKSIQDA